ncbi:hypothetical protein RPMA_02240 [Tardiphaga alba]|uniref:Uncharacterized protein n=1 Tax=Tardiphaga alba TaxID=340268 RepID=A0ABX8A2Q0_9BRAD|nr:hypothetical protein [Tardiphaga alba]QUS37814.1 hypothetical protein RPMA_02240 [Tardiphaga alba]
MTATMAVSGTAYSGTLKFNGALFNQQEGSQDAVTFRLKKDSNVAETLMIRSIEPSAKDHDVSEAFIARAKAEAGGAKLLVMDNAKKQEVMVAYIKELDPKTMLYKVERLSALTGLPAISVAYSTEFRSSRASDRTDSRVKKSAIQAIAGFDMNKARTLLKPER